MTRLSLLAATLCLTLLPLGRAGGEEIDKATRKATAVAELRRRHVAVSADNLRGAAMGGDAEVVQLLLDAGVDPNTKLDELPQSILSLASVTSCTLKTDPKARDAVIAALLKGGADPNVIDIGEVPLLVFVAQQCPRPVIDAFVAAGARLDVRSPQGFTPLAMAFIVRNLDAAEALVDHGARLSPEAVALPRAAHGPAARGARQARFGPAGRPVASLGRRGSIASSSARAPSSIPCSSL